MKNNRALTLLLALVMAMGLMAAKPAPEEGSGPDKVWICHFHGHTVEAFPGGGTTLDGDYVVRYRDGMPLPDQHEYCESRGGDLIIVSTNALDGHGAQLQGRLDGYPDGYRG